MPIWPQEVAGEFARRRLEVDASVVEELAQHAAAAYEAARAEGLAGPEAEASVRALIHSWCSATTGPRRLHRVALVEAAPAGRSPFAGLGLDLRQAVRLLVREPGSSAVSIVMIALALAATTSLFSVVNGVLLKPLPWAKLDGLVRVYETGVTRPSATPVVTNLTYRAWAEAPQTIEGLGGWSDVSMALDGPSGVELVRLGRVTASLFPLLGIAPSLGVAFTEADERTDAAVILSHGFWQERFGGAPAVLGQSLTIGGRARTIVGVMPRGFEFPTREMRMWLPERVPQPFTRRVNSLDVSIRVHNALARLKPGATPAQAASEAMTRAGVEHPRDVQGMLVELFGGDGRPKIAVMPMLDWIVQDVKPALWILMAAVVLLFVAAVSNVASMHLARAAARQREVAIRSAIGAGSGRLARQLFVETSTIVAIGGVAGLALTAALLRLLPSVLPDDFPRAQEIAIDARVLFVVTALTLAVSVIISLLPVRMTRRVMLTSALAEDGAAPVGSRLRSPTARSRALLIAGQVAVAAVLLIGAALLSRSFLKSLQADRGYQPANVMTARITHLARGLPPGARAIFYRQVLERLAAARGVTHAALASALPLTPSTMPVRIRRKDDPSRRLEAELRIVSADYFAAMGMRLVRGRGFTHQDVSGSRAVAVVNETFVRQYITGDPIDVPLDFDGDELGDISRYWGIIGVVADVKHRSAGEQAQPEIFATFAQFPAGPSGTQYVTARTTGDPASLAADLRTIVRGASATAVLEQVMTMESRLMMSLARPRLYAVLLSGFGMFALLIAGIGLFGGLSYAVSQRRREIGVRTALGATPRDIVRLVVRQGVVLTVSGLAIGFVVATTSVRYLAGFLFGVTPFDPATYIVVGAALLVVATMACAIPARRAARIDAIDALKR